MLYNLFTQANLSIVIISRPKYEFFFSRMGVFFLEFTYLLTEKCNKTVSRLKSTAAPAPGVCRCVNHTHYLPLYLAVNCWQPVSRICSSARRQQRRSGHQVSGGTTRPGPDCRYPGDSTRHLPPLTRTAFPWQRTAQLSDEQTI